MTHNEKVLALLSDGEPHSHHELYALHVMGHSRISNLRAQGHVIECWRDGPSYWYQLVTPLAEPAGAPYPRTPTGSASGARSFTPERQPDRQQGGEQVAPLNSTPAQGYGETSLSSDQRRSPCAGAQLELDAA